MKLEILCEYTELFSWFLFVRWPRSSLQSSLRDVELPEPLSILPGRCSCQHIAWFCSLSQAGRPVDTCRALFWPRFVLHREGHRARSVCIDLVWAWSQDGTRHVPGKCTLEIPQNRYSQHLSKPGELKEGRTGGHVLKLGIDSSAAAGKRQIFKSMTTLISNIFVWTILKAKGKQSCVYGHSSVKANQSITSLTTCWRYSQLWRVWWWQQAYLIFSLFIFAFCRS